VRRSAPHSAAPPRIQPRSAAAHDGAAQRLGKQAAVRLPVAGGDGKAQRLGKQAAVKNQSRSAEKDLVLLLSGVCARQPRQDDDDDDEAGSAGPLDLGIFLEEIGI
jgi:hypothetical protein